MAPLFRKVCTAFLLPVLLGAQPAPERLQQLFRDYYEADLRENPELATSIGRSEYNDRWRDWSKAARDRRRIQAQTFQKQLQAIGIDGLSAQDRISAQLMNYQLRDTLEGEPIDNYLMRVYQLFGLHTHVYSTIDQMPFRTVKDYENILARLNAVPAYVDQNIELINEGLAQGVVQPRLITDLVLGQLSAQIGQSKEQSVLLAAFRRFPAGISAADQERLKAQAAAAYDQRFLPAWKKFQAYLQTTYAPQSRATTAVTALQNGSSLYTFQVRRTTTTSLTPQQIHETGKSEVARIEAAMAGIMKETGFTGTVAEFDQKLANMPEQHFRDREEMLAYCRNAAMTAEPELPRLFKRLPRMPFGIRAIPPDREAATASNYTGPATDGTRAGWFNLNAYQPEKQVRYNKEALVLHEGVPGHHLQIALQRELEGLPDFRRLYFNNAYAEGWGLYAESLGAELGLYRDPYNRFGQLSSERFRAVRLVVDTGLHALGWSRSQAIDYFQTHAGGASLAEIDRYIGWPGQALAYKIGELKITELRRRAEKALGAKFDVREFHDVILRNGPLPLELLEQQVDAYLAAAK